ncbi:MAG: tripartite tricarboxylate transporter permease [Synergistaceae bacterium]|jgi:putative tricarboxylic transport membrane protein|nr:tripartite tricarboxylate transporter permease [Synergistaceae bacterium]
MTQNLQYFLIPFMDWRIMLLLWGGVFAGIWVGAIPGLSGTMAVSLLISFTFSWEINDALAVMCGTFVGAVYGGAITAILLNIPGAPAAIATGMEGYPLAQKGEAGKAIGLCTTVSLFAGFVGVAALAAAAPIIARFALKFSPRDFFLLAVMGILLIGSIGGGDPIKGIMSGTVGILISMIGMDPSTGELRYTFGSLNLMAGISFVTAMIGLFGVSEALTQFRTSGAKSPKQNLTKVIPDWPTFKKYLPLAVRSSLLGVFIGALPGTGGDVAALLAYDQAKRTTRNPETPFGHGAYEGLVAPETANKGAIGGAFIPMLTLGIPGDAITAIIIGALFIHGLRPGPMLMIETPHLFWMIVSMLIIANVALFVLGLLSVRPFAKIIEIPKSIIMPIIIILSVIGTYAIQNSVVDVFYMTGFGVLGYFMRLYGYATGPMVLGLILGPMLDSNYRRTMQIAEDRLFPFVSGFFTSPLSFFLTASIVFMLFSQTKLYRKWRGIE